ncbi:MAG: ABC transporter C-terminal domain-containing protein, partial [Bacteroidales bacterium]|nr:ABC transporter C-terminal domain-containing protein [Bacteroidales bacterium]
ILLQQTKKTEKLSLQKKEPKVKLKLSYKEQREYDQLEIEIEELEVRKMNLEESLDSGISDYTELEKISLEISDIIGLLDSKTQRWMELDESVS